MRNVPSLPPPITVPEEAPGVKLLGQSRAPRPVTEPSRPPMVITRYGPSPEQATATTRNPADMLPRNGDDRRKYCRRTEKTPQPLMDTRANTDRRHRNRRKNDIKTNVEEEV